MKIRIKLECRGVLHYAPSSNKHISTNDTVIDVFKTPPRIALLSWILLAIILSGCGAVATRTKFYKPVTAELEAGSYSQAAAEFNKVRFDKKDRFLYYVDS
jgi:hypothetical protein